MPSDVMRDVTLGEVTPRPGKGALGTWRDAGHSPRRRAGKKPKPKRSYACTHTEGEWGEYAPAFKPPFLQEGSRRRCQGQNRNSGNPTVRDRREAEGKRGYERREYGHCRKALGIILRISTVRAPRFYPDPDPVTRYPRQADTPPTIALHERATYTANFMSAG
jgi:hypothetical protein